MKNICRQNHDLQLPNDIFRDIVYFMYAPSVLTFAGKVCFN